LKHVTYVLQFFRVAAPLLNWRYNSTRSTLQSSGTPFPPSSQTKRKKSYVVC
jgi:hypothetical protein